MRQVLWINLLLAVVTLLVYLPVRSFDYIHYDDPLYVFDNQQVMTGINADSIRWALTAQVNGEWHPVTMWSHMLDVQLFDDWAGGHHLVNVLLHVVNVLLLFGVLRMMSQQTVASAVVALLFAIHPLNVETVAWISQRKSLLSALFWLASMGAYVSFMRTGKISRYILLLVLFCMGLMSKPILVVLPCALLLIDVWPLGRTLSWKLVAQKLPLFALSAIVSGITLNVQGHGLRSSQMYPLLLRLENTVIGYMRYMGKFVWPTDLAVFYPFPQPIRDDMWPWPLLIAAVLVILFMTAISVRTARQQHYRYVAVGWCWFLGVMFPMIGMVVQQGDQALADRFMYLPMIGLLIALAWAAKDAMQKWPALRVAVQAAVVAIALGMSIITFMQLQHWRDTLTVFHHAIQVTKDNLPAQASLGHAYLKLEKYPRALKHYQLALQVHPKHFKSMTGSGIALFQLRQYDLAIVPLRRAIDLAEDGDVEPHLYLGMALTLSNQPTLAVPLFEMVLHHRPDDIDAHTYYALALMRLGQLDDARAHIDIVLDKEPAHEIALRIKADIKAKAL